MDIVYKILHDKSNRQKLISEFQEMVWSSEVHDDLQSQLAYDLDFYEPDEVLRAEDGSFYGDVELEMLLKEFLEKVNFKESKQ
jgi:hypothetical protein